MTRIQPRPICDEDALAQNLVSWGFLAVVSCALAGLGLTGFRFLPFGNGLLVLVERIAGKAVSSEALASYGTGWQALGEMWPLMLFCSMAGYCLGFGYHSLYYFLAIEQAPAGEKTSEKKKITDLVENEWNSPWIQEIEVKKLRALLQQANSELFAQKVSAGECRKQAGVLARKTESLQRDLFNARAKIRRLETKQRRRSVDQSPMSEYNDDM